MTTTTATAPRGDAVRSSRDQITGVAWFVGLTLAFATATTIAAAHRAPTRTCWPSRWHSRPR